MSVVLSLFQSFYFMKLNEYDLFDIFIAEENRQPKTISSNITDCILKIAKTLTLTNNIILTIYCPLSVETEAGLLIWLQRSSNASLSYRALSL